MSKVFKLGITDINNKEIKEVKSIEVLANKGVIGDRHFKDFNDPYCQLSLIESENIDYYNLKYGLDIPYINFRRNIVTKGIQLNELVGKKLKIGNGMNNDTILGPLTTKKRLDGIEKLVEVTKKEGAKILCGGKKPAGFNKGYFYEPTIFDNIKDDYTIMHEEPFGPLVPILAFKDFDEVIERANKNDLGLASYIYTNNLEKAYKASELMETGTVAVNTGVVALPEAPFGGIKQTGYGREGGSMAIKDYLNIKYTHLGIS